MGLELQIGHHGDPTSTKPRRRARRQSIWLDGPDIGPLQARKAIAESATRPEAERRIEVEMLRRSREKEARGLRVSPEASFLRAATPAQEIDYILRGPACAADNPLRRVHERFRPDRGHREILDDHYGRS